MDKQWKVEDLTLVVDRKKGKPNERNETIGGEAGSSGGHGRGSTAPVMVLEVEPTLDDIPLAPSASVPELSFIADGLYHKVGNNICSPMPVTTGKLIFELRQLLDNSDMIAMQRQQLSGKLTRNYAAIQRGVDAVFQRRHLQEGIDSAVIIAVDQSSSMGGRMKHAADAVRLLCEALRRCVGTSYVARGFSDASMANPDGNGTIVGERAQWYEYKGWADSFGSFNQRAGGLYRTMGGTPEIAALADSLKELSKRNEERKLLIWIGDGDGYSSQAMIALQKKYPDVTVIAFGIGVDLSPYFKHNVKVANVAELAKASLKKVVGVVKENKAA